MGMAIGFWCGFTVGLATGFLIVILSNIFISRKGVE